MSELSLAYLLSLINSNQATLLGQISSSTANGTTQCFVTSAQIASWNNMAPLGHTHVKANITDFAHQHAGTDITSIVSLATTATTANNVPTADVGGNIWVSVATGSYPGLPGSGAIGTAVAPSSPIVNQVWFDINNKLVKFWDGANWQAFGAVYF